MRIELHSHTYYSDGSLSPKEVVNLAVKRKIKILAVTDHDTVAGVSAALKATKGKNIKLISGIEITSKVHCSNDPIHIIGLYIDINHPKVVEFTRTINASKKQRTLTKLNIINKRFNSNITYEDLQKKTLGIPSTAHIAMVLLDKKIVKDIKEGITLMTKGGIANLETPDKLIHARESIYRIHEAGGVAILAHLSAYKNENKFITFNEQEELIEELVSYGLDGLEIYIPDVTKKEIKFGLKMAKRYQLKLSGGSDFHDEKFIPQNKLGFLDIDKEKLTILKD